MSSISRSIIDSHVIASNRPAHYTRHSKIFSMIKRGMTKTFPATNPHNGKKPYLNGAIKTATGNKKKKIGYTGVIGVSGPGEPVNTQQGYIHSVFESVSESFFLLNADNAIMLFNKRGERLIQKFLQVKVETGMNLIDILPAYRREDVREKLARVRTGISLDYEVPYHGGGWLWVSLTPVRRDDGTVNEICLGLKDITGHKNLELRLRKSEEQYRSLFDSLAEGVVYQSADKKIITCNHSAEKILRIKKELIGKDGFPLPAWEIINEKREKIHFEKDFPRDNKGCQHIRDFIIGIKRPSSVQWLSLNIEPVHDTYSGTKGCVYSFSDITWRKKMDKELKILFMAAMKINNSVVITDSKRRIVWANQAFTDNTGYEFEEIKGKVPGHFLQGTETDPATIAFMREALRKSVPFECEVQNYKKTGEKFWMRIQVQPLSGHNGNISGYLGVGADITEQKNLQEKLIRQKIEVQKEITRATISGQEKERSEIGRELHDNINQVLAAAKIQLDCHLKSVHGRPACVASSYEYLKLAIKEIRSLSKRLVSPRFQENKLLEEIELVIGNLGLESKTKVRANNFREEQIPEEIKLTIFRIIQEQLNNIVKYARAGSIVISLETDGNGIALTIKDDGVGFDTTRKRKGIGLNNIYARADLYSGSAKITSAPGEGCCLEVFLPFKKEE